MRHPRQLVTPFLGLLLVVSYLEASPQYVWEYLVNIPTSTFEKAFLPSYLNFTSDVLQSEAVSDACKSDIHLALSSLRQRQNWAVKLFNSWGKFPPSGLTRGTLTDFGDYDQCLSIENVITPQYCLMDVSLPMPAMPRYHNYHQKATILPELSNGTVRSQYLSTDTIFRHLEENASVFYYVYLKIGFCLPKNCRKKDIATIAKNRVSKLGLQIRRVRCETKPTKVELNYVQLGAVTFVIFTVVLTFLAAIYDRVNVNKSEFKFGFLIWFSPARNIRKLLNTQSGEDELACVHGMRFLTIIWIMMAHTLEWTCLNIYRDTFLIPGKLSQANLQLLFKAFYSVETFFYLSGLLTSYVTLKYTGGLYKKFNYFEFIVLRWFRLTPQLLIFLLLTSLMPILFNGPLWQSYIGTVERNCYKNWWLDALYLQNVIDIGNICAVHTWYLAADMQLHWISLLPVVLLLLNRRYGLLLSKALIVASACISGGMIYINNFPPGHIITSKNDFLDESGMPSDFVAFLYKPWNHASVFFIGFVFGVCIPNAKNNKNAVLKLPTKYFLWVAVFAGYLFSILSTLSYVNGRPYDQWSGILFPLNRIIWALTLSLLIWLCVTNNGGIVGRVLSWSGFKPFSRMTYAIYLTHAWILYIVLGARRDLIDLSTRSITFHLAGVILCSFAVGFLFNVTCETPIINMLEFYKNWRTRSSKGHQRVNQYDVNGNGRMTQRKDVKLLEIRSNI